MRKVYHVRNGCILNLVTLILAHLSYTIDGEQTQGLLKILFIIFTYKVLWGIQRWTI